MAAHCKELADTMRAERAYASLESDRWAEVIAVHVDPLRHVSGLRHPVRVITHGIRFN